MLFPFLPRPAGNLGISAQQADKINRGRIQHTSPEQKPHELLFFTIFLRTGQRYEKILLLFEMIVQYRSGIFTFI